MANQPKSYSHYDLTLQGDQHTCLTHDRHVLSRNFNLNDPKRTTLLGQGEVDEY